MAMTQEQQKQVVMGVVAVGLFGYVYFNYLLKPKTADIQAKTAELTEVNGRIESLRATASQRDLLLQRVEELKGEVAKVERRLPRQQNIQDVIRVVSQLAAKHGVRYSTFSPLGTQSPGLFTEISFGMNITGSVHSIGKFLAALGQQERIFSAKNLSISYAPEAKRNQTVSGSFTLFAYSYNG
jgi:Tfp pilus assembly protein PilO